MPPVTKMVRDLGMQRVGPLVELPHVLHDFGVDLGEVLREVGLAPQSFDSSDSMVHFATLGELLDRCVEKTGCPHLGLLVGSRALPEHFGLIGELMSNAQNLGVAISDLAANQHRYVRGSVVSVVSRDDSCVVTYSVHQSRVSGTEQIVDTAVAAGFAVLRSISGLAAGEVWLPRKPPRFPRIYRDVFESTPRFDKSVGGLVYSRQALTQPVSAADADERRRLEILSRDYRAVVAPTFAEQVQRQLGARITAGTASKSEIAAELGVHQREMSRRLLQEGTTFRDLTNQAQFEVACQLLDNTALTVGMIASALRFGDASAFIKAFRRASGETPLVWRERKRKAGPQRVNP